MCRLEKQSRALCEDLQPDAQTTELGRRAAPKTPPSSSASQDFAEATAKKFPASRRTTARGRRRKCKLLIAAYGKMNTSQPVSSQIGAVSFGFLTSTDIRALSARRIVTATTFDTLLNPVPGGLYSAELGQFGDNACATCGLKNPQCPGHCGHIEMPVPCYHPTFMDQVLRLMRATCIYCNRLRLGRVQVHKFICRLRLVKYGLLKELQDLDDQTVKSIHGQDLAGPIESASEDGSDDDANVKDLINRRERFVKNAISIARKNGTLSMQKSEATTNARRAIIADFMATITKGKKCANCKGVNHKYRKDRFVKIFRKPLTEKERTAMVQSGHRARDPMVELQKKLKAEMSRKRKRDRMRLWQIWMSQRESKRMRRSRKKSRKSQVA